MDLHQRQPPRIGEHTNGGIRTVARDDLTEKQTQILKHTLGADSRYPKHQWGFRNHFFTGANTADYPILLELENLGFMARRDQPPFTDKKDFLFYATKAGCELVGLTKKRIKKMFRKCK